MGDQVMESIPSSNLEERLVFLEREANFWRVKFEELEKWRENLEDWVLTNFGFHIRTNTRTAGASIKFSSLLSSPSNGWSPDSSDISSQVNNLNGKGKVKRKARRRKEENGYKEGEEADAGSDHALVPKRKRGRPKKTQAVSVITCAAGPNATQMSNQSESTPEMKSESNENTSWETEGENVAVPVKRGRGRPKKVRTESVETADEDGDKQKKKGRKKRAPGMPFTRTCEICGLEFDNNQDLLSHKRVIHPEKFHKCTICNDTYLHAGFLARHMESHTLDRDYKCHMCVSSFNTYQLLKTHCLDKHGVDLGRQSDWKRDTELAMVFKNQEFGQQSQSNEDFGLQSSRLQSQSMIPSPTSNCGHGNQLGRSNISNHTNMSHSQHHQQQQQPQSLIHQHSHQQSQIHHHHMQQQQSTPPPHAHHSQLQQQHHHHQQQHHHLPQRSHHHHHLEDDDDADIDNSFPLDFGSNVPDTLPPLFDPSSNDVAMNNYLNSMDGGDPMQLY